MALKCFFNFFNFFEKPLLDIFDQKSINLVRLQISMEVGKRPIAKNVPNTIQMNWVKISKHFNLK